MEIFTFHVFLCNMLLDFHNEHIWLLQKKKKVYFKTKLNPLKTPHCLHDKRLKSYCTTYMFLEGTILSFISALTAARNALPISSLRSIQIFSPVCNSPDLLLPLSRASQTLPPGVPTLKLTCPYLFTWLFPQIDYRQRPSQISYPQLLYIYHLWTYWMNFIRN